MHRHFSNPPTATVPHTAMSNGLIGLLCKCVEIKKNKNGESKREDVEMGGRVVVGERDRVGINGLITA